MKAGGGTVGAQPGEVLEPWGGVWRGGGDLGAESGGGVAGRNLVMRGVGAEPEVGGLEGRLLWGGAMVRGRGFGRRSGLKEMMGRGGAP